MSPELSQNLQESITKLANLLLLTFLLLIGVLAAYAIWHMRMQKMREYKRQKYSGKSELGEKLEVTSVLPDLTKDEMKKIALEVRAQKDEETLDLESYEGLPLKPGVYFDPEKDAKADDEMPAEPKIVRSFLSNEPLLKSDEDVEKQTVEEAYKSSDVSWEPEDEVELEDDEDWETVEEDEEENGDDQVEDKVAG